MNRELNYNFIIFIINKKIIINTVKNTQVLKIFCFIIFFYGNWQIYPYFFTRKYTFCQPLLISSGREVYPAPPCPLKSQILLKRCVVISGVGRQLSIVVYLAFDDSV
jgi:hypothetical protein